MTLKLAHFMWPLPPEGAAAPAVWQSQSRGPYFKRSLDELFLGIK